MLFTFYRLFLILWKNLMRMLFPWPSFNPDCMISIKSKLISKFKSRNWIHSFMFIKFRIMLSPSKPYIWGLTKWTWNYKYMRLKMQVTFVQQILSKISFDWISALKVSNPEDLSSCFKSQGTTNPILHITGNSGDTLVLVLITLR